MSVALLGFKDQNSPKNRGERGRELAILPQVQRKTWALFSFIPLYFQLFSFVCGGCPDDFQDVRLNPQNLGIVLGSQARNSCIAFAARLRSQDRDPECIPASCIQDETRKHVAAMKAALRICSLRLSISTTSIGENGSPWLVQIWSCKIKRQFSRDVGGTRHPKLCLAVGIKNKLVQNACAWSTIFRIPSSPVWNSANKFRGYYSVPENKHT